MIATLKGERDIDRLLAPILHEDDEVATSVHSVAQAVMLLTAANYSALTEQTALSVVSHIANSRSVGDVLGRYRAPANIERATQALQALGDYFRFPFYKQAAILGAVTGWIRRIYVGIEISGGAA